MLNRKILLRIVINSLIGLGLIFLWSQLVDVGEVLHSVSKINPLIALPVMGCFAGVNILRAFRLKTLLSIYGVPFKNLIYLNFLSQLLSFIIPIRAGEITKGVYLSTQYKVPIARAIVLIFLDRFFDFWLVVFVSLILLILIPNNLPSTLVNVLTVVLFGFSLTSILLLFNISFFRKLSIQIAKLLIVDKIQKLFLNLSDFVFGIFELLRDRIVRIPMMLGLSLVASILEALAWFLLLRVFIDNLEFIRVYLGSMLNALTFLIPAAPGYVGSAEAAGLAVFNIGLGMDKTAVSAATVANHAITIIYMLIFGLFGFYFLKFNLEEVWNKLFKKKNNIKDTRYN
jgi:uncharacterized protein (TIRG00374 family)